MAWTAQKVEQKISVIYLNDLIFLKIRDRSAKRGVATKGRKTALESEKTLKIYLSEKWWKISGGSPVV